MKCSSQKIVPKARVDGRSMAVTQTGLVDIRLSVDGDPDAFILKEREHSEVFASVCADCGFTEFYADDPQRLYRAHIKSVANAVET